MPNEKRQDDADHCRSLWITVRDTPRANQIMPHRSASAFSLLPFPLTPPPSSPAQVGDAYVVLCGYSGVDPDHPTTALRVARAMVHVASSILIPEDDGANAGPRQWHSEGGTAREARRKAAAQAKASRMSGSGALGTGALEGSGRRGVAGEEGGPSLGSHGSGGGLMVGGSGRDGANAGMMLECLPEEVEGEMAGDSGRKEEGEGERENEKGWEGKGWGGKGVSLERGGVSGEVLLRQTVGDAGSGFQRSALKAWTRTTGTGETVDAHGARGGDKAVRRTGTGLNQGAMGASGREASGGVGRGTGTEEEGGSVGAGALYVGRPLEIRVGVHTGPIAASTLGFRRNTLTLVGDTLNGEMSGGTGAR